MLRQMDWPSAPRGLVGVSPSHKSEMSSDSSSREMPEERWNPEKPEAHHESEPGPEQTQVPHPGDEKAPLPGAAWLDLEKQIRQDSNASKPKVIDQYRRARKTSSREKRFKKGSVIDEAS